MFVVLPGRWLTVTINCAERGLLLLRVRDEMRMTIMAYQTLYESSVAFGMRKALQTEQGKADMEVGRDKLCSPRHHSHSLSVLWAALVPLTPPTLTLWSRVQYRVLPMNSLPCNGRRLHRTQLAIHSAGVGVGVRVGYKASLPTIWSPGQRSLPPTWSPDQSGCVFC